MHSPLLLVDDAPELPLLVRSLSKPVGCEVAACVRLADAWEFLQQRPPDLVLLDVNLGGENGLELCRRARASATLGDLPIALFGQWGLPDDVVAGLDAGISYVVCKDLMGIPPEWRRRLREILTEGDGRLPPWSVESPVAAAPADAVEAVADALRHVSVRFLGPEVLRAITRRALRQVYTPDPPPPGLLAWLDADSHSPSVARPALAPGPEVPVALSEWFWRLLGTEASAPVRRLLTRATPRN
jgi:DNA-binding response OmpR family regulator